ncbi:Sec-independent protein translocase TatA [Oceanicaulis sp.]|uniref:Sec-independent protein translocase TatA n=1 Tax=Oceanicaulis sp. TaxID=1924941 RepID=UPI003BABDAA5
MGAHWTGILIVVVLLVLLFGGRGKISGLMGDLAKGVTEFRKGLRDDGDKSDEKSSSTSASAALEEGGAQDSQSTREDERTGG